MVEETFARDNPITVFPTIHDLVKEQQSSDRDNRHGRRLLTLAELDGGFVSLGSSVTFV